MSRPRGSWRQAVRTDCGGPARTGPPRFPGTPGRGSRAYAGHGRQEFGVGPWREDTHRRLPGQRVLNQTVASVGSHDRHRDPRRRHRRRRAVELHGARPARCRAPRRWHRRVRRGGGGHGGHDRRGAVGRTRTARSASSEAILQRPTSRLPPTSPPRSTCSLPASSTSSGAPSRSPTITPVASEFPPLALRPFPPGPRRRSVAARRYDAAFATHPDQGGQTADELARTLSLWVDLAGFLVTDDPDAPGGLAGFCSTRVHPPAGDDPRLGGVRRRRRTRPPRQEAGRHAGARCGSDHLTWVGLRTRDALRRSGQRARAEALRPARVRPHLIIEMFT